MANKLVQSANSLQCLPNARSPTIPRLGDASPAWRSAAGCRDDETSPDMGPNLAFQLLSISLPQARPIRPRQSARLLPSRIASPMQYRGLAGWAETFRQRGEPIMSDIDSEEKLEFGLHDLDSLLNDELDRITSVRLKLE